MSSLRGAFRTQRRVIWALMLRETKTLFGKHKLGYLWALINAAFSIGIFWVLREVGGFHAPHGLTTPVFLLGGFIPFYLFSESVNGGLNAVDGNKTLLAYPQVFPIDILLARSLLKGAMYLCVMGILLGLAVFLGEGPRGGKPEIVFLALFLALALGFGTGAFCSALNLMWPATARIVPIIIRIIYFVSGLFFSVETLPPSARNILYFNPLSHLIELAREGLTWRYESRFVDLGYVNTFLFLVLAMGLLLERYSRRYIEVTMIELRNLTKRYPTPEGFKTVLENVSTVIPQGRNMGILGRNGAGKSTLLRIIGGAELPTSGDVVRKASISWPIGFSGGFQRQPHRT